MEQFNKSKKTVKADNTYLRCCERRHFWSGAEVGYRYVLQKQLKNSPSTNNAQSRTTSLLMFYSPFMQEYYPCFDRQNERERKTYIRHIDQLKKALKQIFR